MARTVVVDVGNTRIKWGLCSEDHVEASLVLDPDSTIAWLTEFQRHNFPPGTAWLITGVHPARMKRLQDWLRGQGQAVSILTDPTQLPIEVALEHPERVGIDRLLDAVAANLRRPSDEPAIIVDVGSAVTVDCVDSNGVFVGGAIAPGLRLMAEALHGHTALLPLVELSRAMPNMPGKATRSAMELGIFWSVVGGIRALVEEATQALQGSPTVYLTGGDSERIRDLLPDAIHWPNMTLEGIRRTAETLL